MSDKSAVNEEVCSKIDVTRPSIARVYDYLLDGKDNFASDREVGERIRTALPEVRVGVRAQRAVLRRAVRHMVGEVGIGQLVDIGSGLPTAGNVHEIARQVDPSVRTVYVDNDPIVLAHARALLADNETTVVVDGDIRDPEETFADPVLRGLIDTERPIGLLLCGILHHILDEEDPEGITARLYAALAPGSHVFVHHLVDIDDPDVAAAQNALRQGMGRGEFRSVERIERFFGGLELVEPGLVPVTDWRPEPGEPSVDDHPVLRLAVAGLARRP